jgi:uncharacterized protein YkwD
LGTATVLWVVALQFISGAIEPPREVDLTQSDLTLSSAGERRAVPTKLAFALDSNLGVGIPILSFPSKSPASIFSLRVIPPVTTTPSFSFSASSTTTTSAPKATTTTARPVPTTATPARTSPPATTAPPTTAPPTTAPPTTTPPTTTPPATTAPPTTAAPSGNFNSAAEADFAGRINGLRASVGKPALAGNGELNNYARWWAKYMADHNSFAHSDIGTLLDPWTIVGENIGAGGNVAGIFGALVNSPGHYNNMVEARFTALGVGVYIDASGKLWTAHVFAG